MNQHLRIAIPLSLAVILSIRFVILLRQRMVENGDQNGDQEAPVAVDTVPATPIIPGGSMFAKGDPVGTVEQPDTPAPKRRFHGREDGLIRWNLLELPEGWDPTLAKSVHNYFESMDRFEALIRSGASGNELETARQELRDMLAALGPDALPTLGAILDHEADFVYRRFMYNAIGGLGPESERATWMLRDYFMKRQKDPSNGSEVGNVIRAMESLQNDTSFEVLQQLIKDSSTVRYRDKLIGALGEHHRREEAAGFIADGLHDSRSKKNRNKFAQALGKIRDADSLPDLYHAFQKENYWVTKQTILGSIGKIGDPNSVPFLEEQARYSREGAVRLAAGRALFRVGSIHALETLQEVSKSEPEPKVRQLMETWAAGKE